MEEFHSYPLRDKEKSNNLDLKTFWLGFIRKRLMTSKICIAISAIDLHVSASLATRSIICSKIPGNIALNLEKK